MEEAQATKNQSGTILRTDDPASWDTLVKAAQPATMLLLIDARIGPALRQQVKAEEVWQDTLREAWKTRTRYKWKGLSGFKTRLLAIAQKQVKARLSEDGASPSPSNAPINGRRPLSLYAGPIPNTASGTAALDREEAGLMRQALNKLPPELRYVVWQGVIEERPIRKIAQRLELAEVEVGALLRRGIIAYKHKLRNFRCAVPG